MQHARARRGGRAVRVAGPQSRVCAVGGRGEAGSCSARSRLGALTGPPRCGCAAPGKCDGAGRWHCCAPHGARQAAARRRWPRARAGRARENRPRAMPYSHNFAGSRPAGARAAGAGGAGGGADGAAAARRVGLALSGGGFRAALFHAGAIARLARAGALGAVEVRKECRATPGRHARGEGTGDSERVRPLRHCADDRHEQKLPRCRADACRHLR